MDKVLGPSTQRTLPSVGSQQLAPAWSALLSSNSDGVGSGQQSPTAEAIARYETTRRASRDELVGQFLVLNYGMYYASGGLLTFMKAKPHKRFVLEEHEKKSVQRLGEYAL